jgi:hypothetical protein
VPVETRRSRRICLGLGFRLVALALALRDVNLAGVGVVIGAANWRLLILALGSYLLTVMAKAASWPQLPARDTASSLSRDFSVRSTGLLVSDWRQLAWESSPAPI